MKTILHTFVVLTWLFLATTSVFAQGILIKPGEKVAFLGDSITQQGAILPLGYVRLVVAGLAANKVAVDPVYAGIGGHTSADLIRRVDKDVLEKKPAWMTLSCGINDVFRGANGGVGIDDFKKNMTGVVDKAQAAGVKVVILTATLVGDNSEAPLNISLLPYNEFLRALAKERNLPLADVNADMRVMAVLSPEERRKNGPMTSDGIHMANFGNQVMALGVLRTLGLNEAQLALARDAWKDLPNTSPVAGQASYSIREYERLQQVASLQNKSVTDLVNEALKKYLDSVLAKPTTN